jgi:hypothetical protein
MGGQIVETQMGQHLKTPAPDMALDNESRCPAQGCATSRMQQWASKRVIKFEATERKEKGLPPHKV